MKLYLLRKVYTNLCILSIIAFTAPVCLAFDFSQFPSNFCYHNFNENLRSTKDTTGLFYYSFEQRRVIKYEELITDSDLATIEACDGSDMILSAPNYGEEALYIWKGPNGFFANTQQVKIAHIDLIDYGIYTVSVKKEDIEVLGKIKLIVKESPTFALEQKGFDEG